MIEPASKAEFVRLEQDYLLRYIGFADTRGIAIAGSITTLYGVYLTAWSAYIKQLSEASYLNLILFVLITVGFAATAGPALFQLWPEPYCRYKDSKTLTHYFSSRHIGTARDYASVISATPGNDRLVDMQLEHCYNLARIVEGKMSLLFIAFFAWLLTVPLLLVDLFIILREIIPGHLLGRVIPIVR